MAEQGPTAEELAALAGFSVAFFKSISELNKLFKKALKEDWDGNRLLAAARNTKWFKTHSESARRAQLLKTSDPAEYKRQLKQTTDAVNRMKSELGVPGVDVSKVALAAFNGGWNEQQIRNYLTKFSHVKNAILKGATVTGLAAQSLDKLRELSAAYGINASTNFLAGATQNMVRGTHDLAYYEQHFLKQAKSKYAGLQAELDSGLTIRDIAEPYIDTMARVLEMNPADINVFDNSIERALIAKDKDGKPTAKTIWQFEEDLKKDARWMQTNNSRESLLGAGRQVLRDFGFSF